MQKLSLLPLLLVTGIGAVWASTLMFPNTNEFPRSPGGAGTISGALTLFGADGTATNTEKLNGVTASGYLQNTVCGGGPISQVWIGVDADGRAICGTRTPLLASIGRFSEIVGTVQVMKNGTSIWTTANITDDLIPGDIVKTDTNGTGTIRFAADESILRLDVSTTVELSVVQLSGQSVAQAILTDGRLWGRILTSTGVNLGGGGLVAGVRGTSVSVVKAGTAASITIIDSQYPVAAAIQNSDNSLIIDNMVSSGTLLSFMSGSATTPVSMPPIVAQSKTMLYTDAWITKNTLADILYMNNKAPSPKITQELTITEPIIPAEGTALCGTNKKFWKSKKRRMDICTDANIVLQGLFEKTNIDDPRTDEERIGILSSVASIPFVGSMSITDSGINDGSGTYSIPSGSAITSIDLMITGSILAVNHGYQNILYFNGNNNYKIQFQDGKVSYYYKDELDASKSTPINQSFSIKKDTDNKWYIVSGADRYPLGISLTSITLNPSKRTITDSRPIAPLMSISSITFKE